MLPLRRGTERIFQPISFATRSPDPRRCRILIAEDDADIRSVLAQALRLDGYEVETATNGREALAAVAREIPRLLLLDFDMPFVDGRGVVAELRRRGTVPAIVIMTASTRAERRAEELGADGFLAKPFELGEVLALARRFCLVDGR